MKNTNEHYLIDIEAPYGAAFTISTNYLRKSITNDPNDDFMYTIYEIIYMHSNHIISFETFKKDMKKANLIDEDGGPTKYALDMGYIKNIT